MQKLSVIIVKDHITLMIYCGLFMGNLYIGSLKLEMSKNLLTQLKPKVLGPLSFIINIARKVEFVRLKLELRTSIVIRDLTLGTMIGSVKECNSLYYVSNLPQDFVLLKMSLSIVSNFNVLIWNKCLSHPSFSYLNYLYSNLFIN
ncbi:hypothetical protein CR513_47755, partial [Mucuna pruriens]